eukprot:349652-Prorocentrum_minimum.AAC.1
MRVDPESTVLTYCQLRGDGPHILSTTRRRSSHTVNYKSTVLTYCQLRVEGPHIMSTTSRRSSRTVNYESGVNFEFDWEACN